jgi:long-chain acyl-CoA synthetase
MILVGGENVYPAEVENALLRHPRVADAAVIGVPDDAAGESVLAHIALEPGPPVSTRELRRFLVERLAPFKLPARYVFVDEIPRNPSGKILRRQLREEHWQGRERQVN